eukprot:3180156-Rhodomonas_salina.8
MNFILVQSNDALEPERLVGPYSQVCTDPPLMVLVYLSRAMSESSSVLKPIRAEPTTFRSTNSQYHLLPRGTKCRQR